MINTRTLAAVDTAILLAFKSAALGATRVAADPVTYSAVLSAVNMPPSIVPLENFVFAATNRALWDAHESTKVIKAIL